MGSKTRIIILQLKEIIYTIVFVVLALLMIFLFIYMFFLRDHGKSNEPASTPTYTPGVYTTSIVLGDHPVSLQVSVDADHINSITTAPLEESVTAMYPLLESCLEDISSQLIAGIPIGEVTYDDSSQYTASILLNAISAALDKASN